jgi:hypothetical protein
VSLALFLIAGALIGAGFGAVFKGTSGIVLEASPPESRVAMTSGLLIALYVGLAVPRRHRTTTGRRDDMSIYLATAGVRGRRHERAHSDRGRRGRRARPGDRERPGSHRVHRGWGRPQRGRAEAAARRHPPRGGRRGRSSRRQERHRPDSGTLFPADVLAHAVSPEAVANVIAFLAGDLAAPVSGAIVPAYGS